MNKKSTIINLIVTFLATIGFTVLIVLVCDSKRSGVSVAKVAGFYAIGAVVSGVLTTFLHEMGHIILAKRNSFAILSVSVLFFTWEKRGKHFEFKFSFPKEELGSVEIVPKSAENIEKRYKKATAGGLIFTAPLLILGALPLILIDYLPFLLVASWAMLLPISAYSVLGNGFPMPSNDGGTLYMLNKNLDCMKVRENVLKIQSELYNGKAPSEIDQSLYFDLPQIQEDDVNFIFLLNARYNYYLDKEDFANAKNTNDRLMTLLDYLPSSYQSVIKADALYNACTFDFNETSADDLMYELDDYLNKNNTATNVRIKLAYILRVEGDNDKLDLFYKKAIKEANKCQIKGLGAFEIKLLDRLIAKN